MCPARVKKKMATGYRPPDGHFRPFRPICSTILYFFTENKVYWYQVLGHNDLTTETFRKVEGKYPKKNIAKFVAKEVCQREGGGNITVLVTAYMLLH